MTWARSQGIKEQGCEPGPPTLGSYAFLLVLLLNPEKNDRRPSPRSMPQRSGGPCHLQMKVDLGQEDISIHLLTPTIS